MREGETTRRRGRATVPRAVTRVLGSGVLALCCGSLGAAERVPLAVLPGSLHADQTARVGARVGGYLAELPADLGSRVKRGDLLGRIEVPELEQQRAALEASLGELGAKRLAAQAVAEAAASERQRIAGLTRSGAINPQVRDEAEQRAKSAEAQLAAADAALKIAHAKLEETSLMIGYASLRAPFDGVVVARDCQLGDLVAAGRAEPLFTVAKVDVLRFRVAVPERTAVQVRPGMPAKVSFDVLGDEAFEGTVSRLAAALDPVLRTMTVEIDLRNDSGKLLPGLSGHAALFPEAGR